MTRGGVDTTSGRDQFARHAHTDDHLASSLVVITGGLEDVIDGASRGTFVEEAGDGLTLRGVDGSGREKGEMGGIALTEPVKRGNTVLGSHDFVRENAGRGTE